uniref:ephrin-A4-like isoform X2 n=1 Tax=Myxine glutinosa TaxID=7769 RepID=UPI00358E900F
MILVLPSREVLLLAWSTGPPLSTAAGSLRFPLLLLSSLALWSMCTPSVSADTHTVYWNTSNTRLNGMDYALHVNIGDYVEFLCPRSDKLTQLDEPSNLLIHQVRRGQYNTCNTAKPGFLRFNCDRPQPYTRAFRHVEKIQRFTPFSLGVEFHPGTDYYYISALEPGGDERCLRLKLSVCCEQGDSSHMTSSAQHDPHSSGPPSCPAVLLTLVLGLLLAITF